MVVFVVLGCRGKCDINSWNLGTSPSLVTETMRKTSGTVPLLLTTRRQSQETEAVRKLCFSSNYLVRPWSVSLLKPLEYCFPRTLKYH